MRIAKIILREPLFQFLLAGAALLLAQHFFAPDSAAKKTSDLRIVVPAEQVAALQDAFRGAHGRPADAAESKELVDRWIDEEVLYRQAVALGMDKVDTIVHRELQQKMRYLLEDTHPIEEPSETDLQHWLDEHADRYAHPATLDFVQVYISRSHTAGSLEARAAELRQQLKQKPGSYAELGDSLPGGKVWTAQSDTDLRRNFGVSFAKTVEALPPGQWSEPIATGLGLHLVRVSHRGPAVPATLQEVRHEVLVDCRQARRDAENRRALDALRAKYEVHVAGAAR